MTTEEYEQTVKAILAAVSSLEKAVTIQQGQIEDLQSEIKQLWHEANRVKTDCKHENW